MQDQMSFAQLCASVLDGGAQPDFMINPENQQYSCGVWPQFMPPQSCPQCPISGDGCSPVAYEPAARPDGDWQAVAEPCGEWPDMPDADMKTIVSAYSGCLPMPYPPAVACAPNSQYAVLIQRAYASIGSELTAVMQYTYGSFILKQCFPEAAETLMAISICEMHHLELLADLLISLGEMPKFCAFGPSQNRCWWRADSRVLTYASSLEKQLTVNIKGEKEAVEFYNFCICRIDDENIKKLLQRIIMDEEHHLDLLNSLYERFCR